MPRLALLISYEDGVECDTGFGKEADKWRSGGCILSAQAWHFAPNHSLFQPRLKVPLMPSFLCLFKKIVVVVAVSKNC
jgi:hypothetical protein